MTLNCILTKANALRIPLPDGSVHCCATSPPYFGLRSYLRDDDPLKPLEIGLEPTPAEFVDAMRAVGREVWRVLRPDASWWLNLGDGFANDTKWGGHSGEKNYTSASGGYNGQRSKRETGLNPKNLLLVPERVVLALQKDGWIVRSKPPWVKVAPMPESTTDRPNVAHESIFLLTKQPTYFFDMEAVRVPSAAATLDRDTYSRITSGKDGAYAVQHDHETPSDPAGRHLRTNDFFTASLDVLIGHHESYAAHLRHVRDNGGLLMGEDGDPLAFWVAAVSFPGAHFATWASRLVEIMIKASTSQVGCCGNMIKKLRIRSDISPEDRAKVDAYLKRKRLV